MKIIDMWKYAWKTHLMKVQADKFWHFLGFYFFTHALLMLQLWNPIILITVAVLGIGKEVWDWQHGRFFDRKDLMADAIGVFFAYMINGMYVQLLT